MQSWGRHDRHSVQEQHKSIFIVCTLYFDFSVYSRFILLYISFSYYLNSIWSNLYKIEYDIITVIHLQLNQCISKTKPKSTMWYEYGNTSLDYVCCEYGDASLNQFMSKWRCQIMVFLSSNFVRVYDILHCLIRYSLLTMLGISL